MAGGVDHQVVEPPADVLADLLDGLVGSDATIHRLATCSMGSSSAAFSISSES